MVRTLGHFIFLLFFGMMAYSCTYYYENEQACSEMVPDTVSFSRDVLAIFNASCTESGCHSGTSPAGSLNLESAHAYQELSHPGTGYINIGNPKHSILYSQLNSKSTPMPPVGKLEQCEIDLILKWIEQGAENN